jgi:hypothetical protein
LESGDELEIAILWRERTGPERLWEWFGDPPLILAVRRYPWTVPILLRCGAGANQSGVEWMTPLMHAAAAGDPDLCRLLLAHGADPDIPDAFGRTARWWAGHGGKRAVVRILRLPVPRELP